MADPTRPSQAGRRVAGAGPQRTPTAAVTTKLPVAATTKLPVVAVTTKLPVATTKLPVAVTTKLPVAVTTKLPVTATTKLPVVTTTKLPVTVTTKLPVAVTTKLPVAAERERPSVPRRFWDDRVGAWVVSVLPGEIYVTDREEYIITVLGSCVSTCVRHPGTGAGGMNHLVLPDASRTVPTGCDGLASIDRLISSVLSYGGRADELEVKIFGGANVIAARSGIGRLNVAAVRDHLGSRGLAIASADVGGGVARRLRYEPRSGRVMLQRTVMRETDSPVSA